MKNITFVLGEIKNVCGVTLEVSDFDGIQHGDDFVLTVVGALQYKKSHTSGVDKRMPSSMIIGTKSLNDGSLEKVLNDVKELRSLTLSKPDLRVLLNILKNFFDKDLILNLIPYYTSHYMLENPAESLLDEINRLSLQKECFTIGMDGYEDAKYGANMIDVYFRYHNYVSHSTEGKQFSFLDDVKFKNDVLDLYSHMGKPVVRKYVDYIKKEYL